MAPTGYRTIKLDLSSKTRASVYTSARTADALQEIQDKQDLYEGVKLTAILEAVYRQGKKDGAREVFEKLDEVRDQVPHRAPGRPSRRRVRRPGDVRA